MMKMNVGKICAAAMISALVISSAAGAAVIESADQEVKLEAPDSNWKVVEEEDAKLVVTDGKNKVSVRKYTKEDEIPMPDTADSGYEEVFQIYYSTSESVYCISGYAVTKVDIAEVRSITESFAVK